MIVNTNSHSWQKLCESAYSITSKWLSSSPSLGSWCRWMVWKRTQKQTWKDGLLLCMQYFECITYRFGIENCLNNLLNWRQFGNTVKYFRVSFSGCGMTHCGGSNESNSTNMWFVFGVFPFFSSLYSDSPTKSFDTAYHSKSIYSSRTTAQLIAQCHYWYLCRQLTLSISGFLGRTHHAKFTAIHWCMCLCVHESECRSSRTDELETLNGLPNANRLFLNTCCQLIYRRISFFVTSLSLSRSLLSVRSR